MRTASLSETERHRLLSSERRRLVLEILKDQTTPVPLKDVASEVAKQEADLNAADSATVQQVKTTLHHIHLPKMDELAVLTYDLNSNQIRQ